MADHSFPSNPGRREAPYGAWPSPLTAAMLAAGATGLAGLALDGGVVYWLESRPREGGRLALVRRRSDGAVEDVTPAGFSVRTRVHEYGGSSFLVDRGRVYFSNFADQRLYVQARGAPPRPLTPASPLRYADFVLDATRRRLLVVREDHRGGGTPVNALAAIDLVRGGAGRVLWQESDFVAYPRLSADGKRLAWIAWDHPHMPWDATALWVADVAPAGALADPRRVEPDVTEAALEPQWSPDGALYFITDRGGWWNLHRWRGGAAETVLAMEAEFAGPLWQLGQRHYALRSATQALVTWSREGGMRLGRLNLESGGLTPFDLPYVGYDAPLAAGDRAYFIGARADAPPALVELDLAGGGHRVVHQPAPAPLPPAAVARPAGFRFATGQDESAHAFFYPPTHPEFRGPAGARPPALVLIHGGPTSQSGPAFNLARQYWTSRGFALIDVNHRGSSGYGRAYRDRLRGQWGVVDVEDAIQAARHAAAAGWVDPARLIIRGGSAGGYTALAALALHDVFAAGASYYGVSDVEALARDTHKFEARYLDGLIGPYPEARDRYRERSPIHHLDGFDRPLIVLQGLDDPVVPPGQSELIVEALKQRGVPVAYVPFAGEQHGFRRSENVIRSLEAELYFYGRVFGFQPADAIEPVLIFNLDPPAVESGQPSSLEHPHSP